jgi:predicted AAA+ superfamily ATPase
MTSLAALAPRAAVLDGTADFVVNLADLAALTEDDAREFLDSNVLTSGMEQLLSQAFARLAGRGNSSGIYKLSESMGGGKTQTMIVAGILARFPRLARGMEFHAPLPAAKPDVVASFTGRSTDKKVWVAIGEALGATFAADRAPSETEWRDVLKDRSALILLDELAFYLVHAASQGSREDGARAATLAGIALTTLFGAVRDYQECRHCVIVIADLQKDWEQGAEELARIMRSNDTLGGTLQSVNNEMSKGAQTIAPVDNSKDELYAILRRRLFKTLDASAQDIEAVADAYVAELRKASAIIERPTMRVREEIFVSYPFHFSTKHLIASFNDNPGFQKTRDVIRLMAAIVRSLWSKGQAEVARYHLLALETADLNDANVASRFAEIKKTLQDAMQTDIANSGTSHAETLDAETDGLASPCARWILSASLSEIHPRGLTAGELAEYLLAPGRSILGIQDALKKLYDTCWYIEQTKSGRYLFNRHKNLNAQVNSYTNVCTAQDRDAKIEAKLAEMFEPRDKRCYQRLEVLPALDQVQLERDKTTLVILKPDTDLQKFFAGQKYKNRVAFLTAVDQTGIFNVNKKAQRLWAINQVVKDLTPDDSQYRKAKDTEAEYQTELFLEPPRLSWRPVGLSQATVVT